MACSSWDTNQNLCFTASVIIILILNPILIYASKIITLDYQWVFADKNYIVQN